MTDRVDRIFRNAHLATMTEGREAYGAVKDASLAVRGAHITWVGPGAQAPAMDCDEVVDLAGRWVTPGLVDCHTHLVYAGSRAREFEQRLGGASYESIARAGGGILSTVNAVRAASEPELVRQSAPRLERLMAEGVTTVEIKSGYGLDIDHPAELAYGIGHNPLHRRVFGGIG